MRYCGHFLIKAEGGAKNYERDHPLPLAWRPFTVVFLQRKGYLTSLRLSRGEAEGEPETRELCGAPNPRTRYSLSNLYHPGMRGFERVVTRGNKKCGLCLYLIHTFGRIACIKSDVRWYKYIYRYVRYTFVARSWCDVMWEELSVSHF